MLGERPDEETTIRTSPGLDCDWSWYAKTSSYAMSLAIAVRSSTLALRLITRGARSVVVRTPFTWSHCRWFAIAADPPFPHENTVAPRVSASRRIAAARSSAPGSTARIARAVSSAYAPKYAEALANGAVGNFAGAPSADGAGARRS